MDRVRLAIEAVRFEDSVNADRVQRRTERLAAREMRREDLSDIDIPDEIGQVEVPLPDLTKFDQFLTTGEPEQIMDTHI